MATTEITKAEQAALDALQGIIDAQQALKAEYPKLGMLGGQAMVPEHIATAARLLQDARTTALAAANAITAATR